MTKQTKPKRLGWLMELLLEIRYPTTKRAVTVTEVHDAILNTFLKKVDGAIINWAEDEKATRNHIRRELGL